MILAADLGADVISMSLGGPSNDERQRIYEKAVDYCNQKGAIVVVAAGNRSTDAKKYAPASCSNTITVAAVDDELKKARFSNYFTEQKFPIAAPGVNILSTVPNNEYQSFNGTSMATPYVASTIGIMKSIQPALTTKKLTKF
jgi:thermitase